MALEAMTFDEFPSLKGTTIVGEPFVVTKEDQERYDAASWVDRAYADVDLSSYPDDLLEGFFALSLVDAITVLNTPGKRGEWWGLNYGLDKVRFVSPLWLGQPIVPTIEYLEVKPKHGGFLVLRRITFSHEGSERPGMVAEWWGFVQRNDDPDALVAAGAESSA